MIEAKRSLDIATEEGVEGGTTRRVEEVPGKVRWGDGPWRLGDLSQFLKAPGYAHRSKEKNTHGITEINGVGDINRQVWSGDSAKQWLHHVLSPSPVPQEGDTGRF